METTKSNEMSPLLWALDYCDLETWRLLGRERAGNDLEELVEVLIDGGVDVEVKNFYGSTPLAKAAIRGHEGVVRVLLKKGQPLMYQTTAAKAR